MKRIIWSMLLLGYVAPPLLATKTSIAVAFFSENITIGYNTDMLAATCSAIDEKGIVQFYRQLESKDYRTLLNDLNQKKTELQLNDWLCYVLMRNSVKQIFQKKSRSEQELICWFLLSQMGFDTRLTYLDQRVYVYVHSQDEVFEIPMIEDKDRNFVNLTNSDSSAPGKQEALYLLNFKAQPKGNAFSFYLKTLPKLSPQLNKKLIKFKYANQPIQLEVEYDKAMVEMMEHYPLIAEREYLELPLSLALSNSLLSGFQDLVKDKTPKQALELLLAFTRSSFEYKEDKEYFGRSKPMIADEVFFYPYSDCEDRSALFYALVRELLDLPMIVVAFPDHLTVAVSLEEELPGAVISYQGRRYYICDPTGPVNSSEIGIFPKSYEKSDFEIISHYK
ncbi:MAG: hypothetical protein IPJ74_17090 [Saprospiraceae bacterium]|nr:hypothetical protein [Saprospiraceae bacterium]